MTVKLLAEICYWTAIHIACSNSEDQEEFIMCDEINEQRARDWRGRPAANHSSDQAIYYQLVYFHTAGWVNNSPRLTLLMSLYLFQTAQRISWLAGLSSRFVRFHHT
jgi:hypothetical protein